MDMNAESVLDALNDFERKPSEIPPILEDYLLRIAQNGEIIFPWCKLKPLLKKKLEIVCDEFNATNIPDGSNDVPNFDNFHYDTLKKSILQAVDAFSSAPFTIQRLCELVTNPKKHYNRTDKYMRGIEKNVLVVSTIEPRIGVQNDANANVNPVVNGMISDSPRDDNDCFNNHENNHENVSSSNLNSPANHVLLDNFANVFPSAACIPSPSNICISTEMDSNNREIDSNFIPNPECVPTQEEEFETQVALELPEHAEPKEEQMDTTSEEQSTSDDKCEVTSAEAQETVDTEEPKETNTEEDFKIEESVEENKISETPVEDVSASEDVKSEADCSESCSDEAVQENEPTESIQCQQDDTEQDDTVSQSDDNVNDDSEVSQSDEACETSAVSSVNETKSENEPEEVSQSTTNINIDCSEQCMELESSSSEEPSVCK